MRNFTIISILLLISAFALTQEPIRLDSVEEVFVHGKYREKTRVYTVTLDNNIPLGKQTYAFIGFSKDPDTGDIGMMYDFTWVTDLRALGYTGRKYTVGRIVTAITGEPVYYRLEESISDAAYDLEKPLLSYENFQRLRFKFNKDETLVYQDIDKKKLSKEPVISVKNSEKINILADLPMVGFFDLHLIFSSLEKVDKLSMTACSPISRNPLDFNEKSSSSIPDSKNFAFSSENLKTEEIVFVNLGLEDELYKIKIKNSDWALWFNEEGVLQKADNGKGLIVELEE